MEESFQRRILKRIGRKLRLPMKLFLMLFFDKKYLCGRHFEESMAGYFWAFASIWHRSIFRLAPPLPFPVNSRAYVSNPKNVEFHPDDLNNFQSSGIYLQNFAAKISLGRGCYIAPNVGMITANHDPHNLDVHLPGNAIILGEGCWIGMNSVLLSGVTLGDRTIVGAGSVVTKSFPSGYCVIAGNPAKMVRKLE